jgi:hypothetical protein
MQNAFTRAVLVAGGIFYTISGVALFFAPQWFYDNIGIYPAKEHIMTIDLTRPEIINGGRNGFYPVRG